jgi:hypothetical protein
MTVEAFPIEPIRLVLDRLLGHKKVGERQWEARCPAHEDARASLSVSANGEGVVLLHCHAGCEPQDIVRDLELSMADLFPANTQADRKPRIAAEYSYADETGIELFQVVRFEPKDFRQRHRGPTGEWVWKMGARRVPYRLPELVAACAAGKTVWVVEGEKDVETLRGLGLTATCNPGGAGKWRPEYAAHFKGAAAVHIIPDDDAPGREHAAAVATALASTVKTVKVVRLPSGKDATDWVRGGGTAEQLGALAAKVVTPRVARSLAELALPLSIEMLRAAPPPRQYLIYGVDGRGVMPRGRVGMLGAPGGTGKSKAVIGLSIAVAMGGRWFGAWPCERGRVLLVLAEEDRDETLRRLHYALSGFSDFQLNDVVNNLTVMPAAGEGFALTYEAEAGSGALPETARVGELRELLKSAAAEGRPYSLVVLDPSSRFAGADVEKDNAAATRYVQVLETLTAAECGSPNVLLPAHTRKRAKDDEPGSTDALRGASGQRDGARWVAMLERRKPIEGAPKLLDFIIGKTNYASENSLVLAAQDDLEGALRAATPAEIDEYESASGHAPKATVRPQNDEQLYEKVMVELSTHGPQSSLTLAKRLKIGIRKVRTQLLPKLEKEQLVTREPGQNGLWKVWVEPVEQVELKLPKGGVDPVDPVDLNSPSDRPLEGGRSGRSGRSPLKGGDADRPRSTGSTAPSPSAADRPPGSTPLPDRPLSPTSGRPDGGAT